MQLLKRFKAVFSVARLRNSLISQRCREASQRPLFALQPGTQGSQIDEAMHGSKNGRDLVRECTWKSLRCLAAWSGCTYIATDVNQAKNKLAENNGECTNVSETAKSECATDGPLRNGADSVIKIPATRSLRLCRCAQMKQQKFGMRHTHYNIT